MTNQSKSLGIINRFPKSGDYPLGSELEKCGVKVVRYDLSQLTVSSKRNEILYEGKPLPNLSTFLWRLSENVFPATTTLANLLTNSGHTLINSLESLKICADKASTYQSLTKVGAEALPTRVAFPGGSIQQTEVAKPAWGASGRDILFGKENNTIPLTSREPWVVQPWAGEGQNHLRVTIVADKIICVYRRIPQEGSKVNNIEAGGKREYIETNNKLESIALVAAKATKTIISGVDLTAYPHKVIEVNGNPGIPPELIRATAEALTEYLSHVQQ